MPAAVAPSTSTLLSEGPNAGGKEAKAAGGGGKGGSGGSKFLSSLGTMMRRGDSTTPAAHAAAAGAASKEGQDGAAGHRGEGAADLLHVSDTAPQHGGVEGSMDGSVVKGLCACTSCVLLSFKYRVACRS